MGTDAELDRLKARYYAEGRRNGIIIGKEAANDELRLLRVVQSAAIDLVAECKGGDIPPSLGSLAKLEDKLHAVFNYQKQLAENPAWDKTVFVP